MKNSRWLVPALALAILAGVVASSYSLMPVESQKTPGLTVVNSGEGPSCCAAKSSLASQSGCCPWAAKAAGEKLPACGCLGGAQEANRIEKSTTFRTVRACGSAIQHSLLITVLGIDSPTPDKEQVEKAQQDRRRGNLASEQGPLTATSTH
jgi:hypothetical protein